jgi:putative membrane protein
MKIDLRSYRTFQALILGGLGIFLLAKIGDGRILLYINQRFVILMLAAAIVFLTLGQMILAARPRLERSEGTIQAGHPDDAGHPAESGGTLHNHAGSRTVWGLWLLALPLLVGLLVPQRPLASSAAALRGFSSGAGLAISANGEDALAIPAPQRNVLDWIRAFEAVKDPEILNGQAADLEGFVYHDPRLPPGHFIAARFSVTCCLADAAAIGVEVDWTSSVSLADSAWVRVKGKMTVQENGGHKLPLLLANEIEPVQAPEQPYLFP